MDASLATAGMSMVRSTEPPSGRWPVLIGPYLTQLAELKASLRATSSSAEVGVICACGSEAAGVQLLPFAKLCRAASSTLPNPRGHTWALALSRSASTSLTFSCAAALRRSGVLVLPQDGL